MRWATRISDALAEDRFEFELSNGSNPSDQPLNSEHYELLLRMRDEMGTVIMPGEFLPAAERYNLADKLDRWVIARAFEWLGQCHFSDVHLCCINLSGQSMGNDDMLDFILEQFDGGIVSPAEDLL